MHILAIISQFCSIVFTDFYIFLHEFLQFFLDLEIILYDSHKFSMFFLRSLV